MDRRTLLTLPLALPLTAANSPVSRVLIVTGGHKFDEPEFFAAFDSMKTLKYEHVRFGSGAEEKLHPRSKQVYDAMLFYDTWQNKEPHWQSWMELLGQGMPSVFLHHALGSYKSVPEYVDIIGGRASFAPKVISSALFTLWKHDEKLPVSIADRDHPITRGLKDFVIHDEVYRGFYVRPDVHTLLTTTHPMNDYRIGWTHRFRNSPVVYLQLGHDGAAYGNTNFRTLVERSVQWASGKI